MRYLWFSILIISSNLLFSVENKPIYIIEDSLNFEILSCEIKDTVINNDTEIKYFTQKRFTAIALVILTGPLGGHRLYLGSKPVVPVFYALTLGGGFFILPVVDLISIIFTKDLSKFENNDKVIMWLNSDKQEEEDYEFE